MRPSFWIKTASYFADIQLETVESVYSGPLEVICRKGRYALCTSNVVYSYDDLYVNFSDSFERLDLEAYQLQNVLVLGLGLGSIPWLLEKKFHKIYNYTFVEIDQKIVNLAEHYTLSELSAPYTVVCQDALKYTESCEQSFDMIVVDLFIDNTVPCAFESIAFLQKLKRLLRKDGLLLYNRLADTPELLEKTTNFYEQDFKKIFPTAVALELGTNRMLINNYQPLDEDQLKEKQALNNKNNSLEL
ncbi:MAG: spermidine synthase [Aureispira sp.]